MKNSLTIMCSEQTEQNNSFNNLSRYERRTFIQSIAVFSSIGSGATIGSRRTAAQEGGSIWQFETEAEVWSSPTIVSGTVYIGSTYPDSHLYAIDAETGEKQWSYNTGSSIGSAPTVVDNIVFFSRGDSRVQALDASTGEEQWINLIGNEKIWSSPTVVDGTVYVGSNSNKLYALDANTGDESWATEVSGDINGAATILDDTVYVGSSNGAVYALDSNSGEEIWNYETDSGVITTTPTVTDDSLFIGSQTAGLLSLDASSGDLNWNYNPVGAVFSSPTVLNGSVFFGSTDSNLYSVDTKSGSKEWSFSADDRVDSAPTVVNKTVFVGSHDNNLYAVNSESGEERWSYNADGRVESPTIADGIVYFATRNNTIYALDARVDGSSEGTRAMLGSLGHHGDWKYADQTISIGDSSNNDSQSNENGIKIGAIGAIGGGVTALAGSYALLKRRNDSNSSTGKTDSTESTPIEQIEAVDPENADQPGQLISDQIDEINAYFKHIREAVQNNDFDEAIESAETTVDLAEEALDTAESNNYENIEMVQSTVDEAKEIKNKAEKEQQTHESLVQKVDSLQDDLNKISNDSENRDPDLNDLSISEIENKLDSIKDKAIDNGFSDIVDRVEELKIEYQNTYKNSNQSDVSNIPDTIPSTSSTSISYDMIEKGEVIGSGGNADVYHATVEATGHQFSDNQLSLAIKEPRMSGTIATDQIKEMMEEANTWQQLDDHNHIVSVVDYDSDPLPWIAMEYMDSGDLGTRAGDFEIEQALWVASTTTKAVRHAHSNGVAHLDIKPANILFRSVENAWDVPKVADWGLSKELLEHSKSVDGMSPQYAAPEQFDPETYGKTDNVTDIYQLGAVFYDLFTGRPPFTGKPFEVIEKIRNEKPTPPSEFADIPKELDDILLTALSTEKSDRYEDVLYMRDKFNQIMNEIST